MMAHVAQVVPGFWWLVAASAVGLLAEIAILVVSQRRLQQQESASRLAATSDWRAIAALTPPSRAPQMVATLVPFALAAAFARAIHSARSQFVAAFLHTDPSAKATDVSRALSAEMNAIPLGLLAMTAVAGVGCVAVACAISARLRARGLARATELAPGAPEVAAGWVKYPGPHAGGLVASIAAFLVLGFAPIAHAEYTAVLQKIHAFAQIAGVSPEEKGPMFDRALDDARRLIDERLVFARAGVGVAALVAALFAWRLSSARARARLLGGAPAADPEPGAAGIVVAGVAIAAAAAAFVAARPLRAENQIAWPPFVGGERLLWERGTPDLEGPDELKRAPVVNIMPDALLLDGWKGDAASIADRLVTLRQNYGLLHPYEPFNAEALLICDPKAPRDRLSVALHAVLDGGFSHATFGFLRRQEVNRPMLGHHWRNLPSAANTTLVEARADADDGAAIIEVAQFATCADLSKEIVASRRAGHDVALLIPVVANR